MKTAIPDSVKRALEKERATLVSKRAELVADIDRQIIEIDEFLSAGTQSVTVVPPGTGAFAVTGNRLEAQPLSPRETTKRVVEIVTELLHIKQYMKTPQIFEAVRARGIVFSAANPEHRLVQILSMRKDIFDNHRDLGWSLKGESPVAAGLSGATTSSQGQPTLRGL